MRYFLLLKKLTLVIIITLLLLFYAAMVGTFKFIQDDTFISLQYAKNFAGGNGLVFNLGERTEGFTAFLWVMIESLPFLLGFNPILFTQALSLFFGALILITTFLLSNKILTKNFPEISKYSYINLVPLILLIFSNTFVYWAVSGMETSFYSFLFLSGIYFFFIRSEHKRNIYISLTFISLAFLTRQEVALIFFLLLLYLIKGNAVINNKVNLFAGFLNKRVIIFISVFILIALALTLFRLFYFGYILPNTFYAKTGFSLIYIKTGFQYFLDFCTHYLIYGALLFLPLITFYNKKYHSTAVYFFSIIIIHTLYVIFIGGDVLTQFRFFIPVLPIIFAMFTFFLYLLYEVLSKLLNKKMLFIPVLAALTYLIAQYNYNLNFDDTIKMVGREKALVLSMKEDAFLLSNTDKQKNLTVASSTIGVLKYFSGFNVLDMVGLTNEYIAHNPKPIKDISGEVTGWKERNYNNEYVIGRKPDYFIFSTKEKPSSYAERALFLNEEFHRNYIVYPLFDPVRKTIRYIYKRLNNEQIKLRPVIKQTNPNYSAKFVHLYVQFLNRIKSTDLAEQKKMFDEINYVAPAYFGEHFRIMASIYYDAKQSENAFEYAKKCIEIDPLNINSRMILARVYKEKGLIEKSKEQINFLQLSFPELAKNPAYD